MSMNPYDQIADQYNGIFSDEKSIAEDKELWSKLEIKGAILDIGCGTGLFLDYFKPAIYCGIDPSIGMLKLLRERHPKYANKVVCSTIEEFVNAEYPFRLFDTIVCLYGVASYINPDSIRKVVENNLVSGGKAYFMFYNKDYTPVTHQITGINPTMYDITDFENSKAVWTFNDKYTVVEFWK